MQRDKPEFMNEPAKRSFAGATDTQLSANSRRPLGRESSGMVVWGVVSSEIEQVIEFFRTRREAERMLAEVVRDEPNWQEQFRIERIELSRESLN